jgi:hypothetical protein
MGKIHRDTDRDCRHRHLVVIDIENIVGAPCPTDDDLQRAHDALRRAVPDLDATCRIVAYNHRAARNAAFWFPGALHRWRSGPDGADLALIDELSDLRCMGRFGQVTLCSGDGIFAEYVGILAAQGAHTTVISVEDRLARSLRLAAHEVVLLPVPDPTPLASVEPAAA